MKLNLNNRGVSSVIAASILLAAIVTVAVTYQAFIVPELDNEKAFTHLLDILYSLEKLYSEGTTTIPLSYSGTPFFSSTTFIGQLSYFPSITINTTIFNTTQTCIEEKMLNETIENMQIHNLSEAILYLTNVSSNIEATSNFINSQEQTIIQLHTEEIFSSSEEPPLIRTSLNITRDLESTLYNYTSFSGDSLEISLFSPLYNLTSTLNKTTQVQYTTNSSMCILFMQYLNITVAIDNQTYTSSGAIKYESVNHPLSYLATPWGVIATEAGTSSIPCPLQIYWKQDTITLEFYNITSSNVATVSGSGSMVLKLKTDSQSLLDSTFTRLDLNFTYGDYDLSNSVSQLNTILQNSAPDETLIEYERSSGWSLISIIGISKVNLTVHNVELILS